MSICAREIIEHIRHCRDLLKVETDPKKRRTIAQLLAEEEARLVMLKEQDRRGANEDRRESC
jgi:hypothetical protein